MATPQWIKKLGGHAGELYVAAELSKRGIPNALLPENFSDDDILVGNKDGVEIGYIQVKSCHPDRGNTFKLKPEHECWVTAPDNQFVVFVWLGSPAKNEAPRYWIAKKGDVGRACQAHPARNSERRFHLKSDDPRLQLNPSWENNWPLLGKYEYT
jgi:hypothetical protein